MVADRRRRRDRRPPRTDGEQRVDYTSCLRSLSSVVRGDAAPARSLFADPEPFDTWAQRWLPLVGGDRAAIADSMDRVNPIYIPRNHIVEEVLTAASWGDVQAFDDLLDAVTRPFEQRPGLERYTAPRPVGHRRHLPNLLRHLRPPGRGV